MVMPSCSSRPTRRSPRWRGARLEWGLSASGDELTIAVAHGDTTLAGAVEAAGFALDPLAGPLVGPQRGMFHPAVPNVPPPPAGLPGTQRAGRRTGAAGRVPPRSLASAAMPFAPEVLAKIPPDATSRFTMDFYERVRKTWLYEQSLDLVAEAPDGRLVACCIVWWDPASGVAEIEPLGVVPTHRRLGLACAQCMEAATRVHSRGGHTVYINSSPDPAYPAPNATYAAAGFKLVERGRAFRRKLASGL